MGSYQLTYCLFACWRSDIAMPAGKQLRYLGLAQQWNCIDIGLRISGGLLQQGLEVVQHAHRASFIKQLGVVFQPALNAASLAHHQRKIEFSGAVIYQEWFYAQRAQFKSRRRTLQSECHLKQRRAAQVTLQLQRIYEFFKWNILVAESFKRSLFDSPQQFGES